MSPRPLQRKRPGHVSRKSWSGGCANAPKELTRLNAALSQAKAEAEEANASKTQFLAAASHDILQPLNAARLYATAMVERNRDGSDASGTQAANNGTGELAENVNASLDAVEEILTALLDISRLDTGALKPEYAVFRLDAFLHQLAREFEPSAAAKGLRLRFVAPAVSVRSDRKLLRRLMQNLISNAIKYTPSGKILVGARRRGGRLALQVHDTGLGIPASKQRLIFQEFQRLDQGRADRAGAGAGAVHRRTHRPSAGAQAHSGLASGAWVMLFREPAESSVPAGQRERRDPVAAARRRGSTG